MTKNLHKVVQLLSSSDGKSNLWKQQQQQQQGLWRLAVLSDECARTDRVPPLVAVVDAMCKPLQLTAIVERASGLTLKLTTIPAASSVCQPCMWTEYKIVKYVDLYSASSRSASNALPLPVSRRWSPQANPTVKHQRTLRDHMIRVSVSRDMPVYSSSWRRVLIPA